MKTVLLTKLEAHWAGMAPSVADGWVAVLQPRDDGRLLALVPADWIDGKPIPLTEALAYLQAEAKHWRKIDEQRADDAEAKAGDIERLIEESPVQCALLAADRLRDAINRIPTDDPGDAEAVADARCYVDQVAVCLRDILEAAEAPSAGGN